MKVLHILDHVNRGGLEILALDLCRNAKANNLDLVFITLGKGQLFEDFKESGADFFYFQRKAPIDFKVVLKLRKVIRENGINIIHAHQDVTIVHSILASAGLKIKVVQTIHGFNDKRSPVGKNLTVAHLIMKSASYFLPISFAVSQYLQQELMSTGYSKSKLKVLNNGIDFSRIHPFDNSNVPKDGNIFFGMLGNFNMARNHKLLLYAFSKLANEYPRSRLKLAGTGDLFNESKEYAAKLGISEKVEFLGSISNVSKFFSSIDYYVHSSRADTFGIAVVEAMYSGLPVIVSDNGPFVEITDNGKLANLFIANNVESLYQKLKEATMDNNYSNQEDSNYIRDRVVKKFSIESHIHHLKCFYKELLG